MGDDVEVYISDGDLAVYGPGGAWRGRPAPLDMMMIESVCVHEPINSAELGERLWPGAAERWRAGRLDQLRYHARRRIGHTLIRKTEGGWTTDKGVLVQLGPVPTSQGKRHNPMFPARARSQRALYEALKEASAPISGAELCRLIWPDHDSSHAQQSLHSAVTRLRRRGVAIRRTSGAYRIE